MRDISIFQEKAQKYIASILLVINAIASVLFAWTIVAAPIFVLLIWITGWVMFIIIPFILLLSIILIATRHYGIATLTCFFGGLMTIPLGISGIMAGVISYHLWKKYNISETDI